MTRSLARVIAALGLIGLLAIVTSVPGRATGYTIQAQNYEFVAPGGGSSLTVAAGDQVTWVASGDPHTVTSGAPGAIDNRFVDRPASEGLLANEDTFTTAFGTPGTYPYFCEIHFEQMTGVITVLAAATAPPTRAPTPRPTPVPTPVPTPPPAPTDPASATPDAAASPSGSSGTEGSASPSPGASASPTESPAATGGAGPAPGSGPSPIVPIAAILIAAGALVGGIILNRRRGGPSVR